MQFPRVRLSPQWWIRKKKKKTQKINLKCCQAIWLTLHPLKTDFPCQGHLGSNKWGTRCLVGSWYNMEEDKHGLDFVPEDTAGYKRIYAYSPIYIPISILRRDSYCSLAFLLKTRGHNTTVTTTTSPLKPLICSHKIGFHGPRGYIEG